ncbi:MAG TPA: Gfo/Idh/MocA family oxidoreductase [Planctomycetota bacterium]|jgi:predicted dehydrogenase|nr:Gfo/Idh/MocA family oxidoreductase [Planctomycetota bacterium]
MAGAAKRSFRVAVAGVGHLGKIHARIWNEQPEAELVAVVDSDAARAGALAQELGCEAFAEASELPDDLDGVSVVVPTAVHADVAVGLLERGIACLVEKPLASNLSEADRILTAAEKGGALLAVGHVERFQPGVRAVRELGLRPRFIESHRLAPFSFRSMDVGVVHDLMIHDLDLVLYLCGSEIASMDAAGGAILTEREDLASVRLVFENGARASVTASRASLTPMRRMRLFSSEGYISLDFQQNYGLMVTKGPEFDRGREALRELDPASLAQQKDWVTEEVLRVTELKLEGEQRPLQAELDSFMRSVRDGSEIEVSGADGRRALELADRIVADIRAQDW